MQGKRHQAGRGRHHLQAELLGYLVTERGRPQLRHRQAAGSHYQRLTFDGIGIELEAKAVLGLADIMDVTAVALLNCRQIALGQQHADDILGRILAEQLAMLTFFIAYVVLGYHGNKVPLGILRQRRLNKVRVTADIIVGSNIIVGKVAAAATGDQDLPSRLLAMINHQHRAATLAGFCRTHQPRSACTNNHHIILVCHFSTVFR